MCIFFLPKLHIHIHTFYIYIYISTPTYNSQTNSQFFLPATCFSSLLFALVAFVLPKPRSNLKIHGVLFKKNVILFEIIIWMISDVCVPVWVILRVHANIYIQRSHMSQFTEFKELEAFLNMHVTQVWLLSLSEKIGNICLVLCFWQKCMFYWVRKNRYISLLLMSALFFWWWISSSEFM